MRTQRGAVVAAAVVVALLFLVAPSLSRLTFLVDPPAPIDPTDAAFVRHRPTGLLHVVPGLVMVALMPLQLSSSLRRRWPRLHRWGGRLFVLVALFVCVTAVRMNLSFPPLGGLLQITVIYAMCVALLAALAMGLRAIFRRDVQQHRRWMVRAMGVALSAGSAGIFVVPFYLAGAASEVIIGLGRWGGFLGTLAVVEWWLRTEERGSTLHERRERRPSS